MLITSRYPSREHSAADSRSTYSPDPDRCATTRQTVVNWRARYAERGLAGLEDEPKPGRPPTIDQASINTETLKPPPKGLGVTHWSTRLLGDRLKVGNSTIAKAWREYGIQPWRTEAFRFSTDPELEARSSTSSGLYLDPPQNAVVLCVDEKSQIQALNRTLRSCRCTAPDRTPLP